MESNPEEFFEGAPKWKFMFNANFREVLTEPEKGALHEALKEVRRKEFDTLVVKELLKEEMEDSLTMRASGRYQLSSASTSATTLSIGNQTLSEEEIARLKATQLNATPTPTSTGWFK
jgi:hypothetical protein